MFLRTAGMYPFVARRFTPCLRFASSSRVSLEGPSALSSGRVKGKTAFVTGGGQGLGEAICRTLAAEGASVVVADINHESARKVAASIPGGMAVQLDVRDSTDVKLVMNAVVPVLGGRLDVVVNNAGIVGPEMLTHEYPLQEWQNITNVNLNGAFYVLQVALQQMMSQDPTGGVILNMTSVTAHSGARYIAPYTAAKCALLGLTRSAAAEYAPHGIRVVGLSPTMTKTPMVAEYIKINPAWAEKSHLLSPLHGIPESKDVAQAALFLCSDESRWVSGSCLQFDGALLASTFPP